ncbi:MAG: cysteine desulfurase family protein [bacterium]|nr:cysteine desulfurase family protein [bacterium]
MVYLDYAANTPCDEQVLESFVAAARDYIGNPNSLHQPGVMANQRMGKASEAIASVLGVKPNEIIYTSGASEANNLAIKGIAAKYRQSGKHIISTALEHSAVSGALSYLVGLGYEVDLLDINQDGTVDLEHLKELLRNDTILVSVGYVDSELGVEQPISQIAEILKAYPNCHFHTDATQAVGKIEVDFTGVDLVSFSPHKFFGLNGAGILIRKEGVKLEPIIHGGASTTEERSGTPVLAMAVATEKALQLAYENLEQRYGHVTKLNNLLRDELKKCKEVRINSTEKSIPYTLNLSVKGFKSVALREALEEAGYLVSPKSACSVPNTPSRAVLAVSRDRKAALSCIRISMSHLTTEEEIKGFVEALKQVIINTAN